MDIHTHDSYPQGVAYAVGVVGLRKPFRLGRFLPAPVINTGNDPRAEEMQALRAI
jgi:hypothetical protein